MPIDHFQLLQAQEILKILLLAAFAYALGSLSSAVLVCKCMGLPDPRTEGSKNPGATNVLRIGGKFPALLTLLGDVLKGVIPVVLGLVFSLHPIAISVMMLAVFLGHLYPFFFGFQGGKGVATLFGIIFALCWPVGVATLLTWLAVFMFTRISSLGALASAVVLPFYLYYLNKYWLNALGSGFAGGKDIYWLPVTVMSIILIWRHSNNIKRLLRGEETKSKLS